MATLATLDQISRVLRITPQRVTQLVKAGVLPREGRGQYNVSSCVHEYIGYLQHALKGKASMDSEGEIVTLKNERSRLLKAQADTAELELAQARGQAMAVVDHEQIMTTTVLEARARTSAVAARISPKLVGLTTRVMAQAIVDSAMKEAWTDIAKRLPAIAAAVLQHAQAHTTEKRTRGQ